MTNLTKSDDAVKNITMNQSLVHIKHSITIRQYKYWHLMLKFFSEKIDKGLSPDKNGFYFESRSKFAEYIGYDIKTTDLKMEIEALRKEPIIINYLEKDGKPAIHGMGFISEYKITSNQIGYRLPSFVENVVRGDDESKKMFLLLNWNIFNSFTGKYEAIIYKLCKDYIGIGRTPYFTIDDYREYIGLKKSEYVAIDNLTRRCIKNPTININNDENCDISVQIEFEKQGRKIKGLFFKVEYKKQGVLPFEEFKPCSAFAFAKISIPQEKQIKYLEMYSEEQIAAIIERANDYVAQLERNGKPVKIGAIYNKAFSDNWGSEIIESKQGKQEEQEKRQRESDFIRLIIKTAATNNLMNDDRHGIIVQGESQEELTKRIALDYQRNLGVQWVKKLEKHEIRLDLAVLASFGIKYDYSELNSKNEDETIISSFDGFNDEVKKQMIETSLKNCGSNPIDKIIKGDYKKLGIDAYKQNGLFKSHLIEYLKKDEFFLQLTN